MAISVPVKILSISDKVIDALQSSEAVSRFKDIDIILACGDLPYYYVENVFEAIGVPTFFVRGNHASVLEYGVKGPRSSPDGAIDLHQRVININNVLLAGFEGSVRYRTGPFMYTQTSSERLGISDAGT